MTSPALKTFLLEAQNPLYLTIQCVLGHSNIHFDKNSTEFSERGLFSIHVIQKGIYCSAYLAVFCTIVSQMFQVGQLRERKRLTERLRERGQTGFERDEYVY